MKILVTGSSGQLGSELVRLLQANGVNVTGVGGKEMDYCHPDQVREQVASFKADWVINCAAYTKVDLAEQEQERAFLVNRDSVRALAEGVERSNGKLLHVSTDFIFDGKQPHPYSEEDRPNPLGVYGLSKLAGEEAVLDVLPDATIVRTAWVYGVHGQNFVKTMLNLAAERDEIKVVDDQVGTPTWTNDLAMAIYHLVNSNISGVYNFTNEGVASWYDFAGDVIDMAGDFGCKVKCSYVKPIPACEYTTLAQRPQYSVLSKRKIRSVLDYPIPHWRESLRGMLTQLLEAR